MKIKQGSGIKNRVEVTQQQGNDLKGITKKTEERRILRIYDDSMKEPLNH